MSFAFKNPHLCWQNKEQSPQKHWSAWTCPLDTIQYWPLSGRHSAQVFVPSQGMLWSLWRRAAASLLTPHWTQPSFSWKCKVKSSLLCLDLYLYFFPPSDSLVLCRDPCFTTQIVVSPSCKQYLSTMLRHVIVIRTVWGWLWYCTCIFELEW